MNVDKSRVYEAVLGFLLGGFAALGILDVAYLARTGYRELEARRVIGEVLRPDAPVIRDERVPLTSATVRSDYTDRNVEAYIQKSSSRHLPPAAKETTK